MYKQGERIDYIVIPIPKDLGMNSKLKKVISVSANVHRLLKRNNLITVRDLVEIDYEEIATFRASVSQKTIIHGAKQELEEYLSDEVYEKEHEYVGKEPETVIPDEAIAEVNKILKDDYSERIHAYKREDIWRCRYSRIELEVTRIQDADSSLGLFLSGLDTLKAGFDMANVCPVDKMLCTRSWLVRLLRVMIDNPIFDQNLRKETLDAERNEIVKHSIGVFSEICKWSKQVQPYSEHDKYQNLAETLSSVVYDFVAEHFAPRKNEFGMILSPRDNMSDAVRGALFPGGENPRRFGLFERMAEVCFVVPFLQKPRRPLVLKKNMPHELILDAANRASKLKAHMETRRDIARFKQYNFASRRVEDDLKHHLLDSLFGCGDTKYLDMLKVAYEVNPYATWEENGCRKQELLDRDVLQSKTDVHEWLVEGMGSHQSSFPIH